MARHLTVCPYRVFSSLHSHAYSEPRESEICDFATGGHSISGHHGEALSRTGENPAPDDLGFVELSGAQAHRPNDRQLEMVEASLGNITKPRV